LKNLFLVGLLLPALCFGAEITFTPEELAEIEGAPGPQGDQGPSGPQGLNGSVGPQGADGADGTRITELAGTCSADIGGEVFEWACSEAGAVPDPDPEPEPEPDPACFDGCEPFGSGNFECADRQPQACWTDTHSERQGPAGFWIYEVGGEPEPGPEPEPEPEPGPDPDPGPDPGPDPDPEPGPDPDPGEPSAYRGIPDPSAYFGYDVYANYPVDLVVTGNTATISGQGTASDPYFVDATGLSRNGGLTISGSYVIVQGGFVDYPNTDGPALSFGEGTTSCQFCTVRDMEVFGSDANFDAGHDAAVGLGSNNVWLRGSIHGFGDRRIDAQEQDYHGIKTFGPNVWILDAEIYDVSGDSVQVGDASRGAASNVYIGGGYMHHNRENGIDVKDSRDVVVSGVKMEGFRPTASSPGEAFIIHDDAFDAKILDNVILDATRGIVSSGASGHLIEGNNITALAVGIELRNTGNITVRDNTISAPTCVNRQGGVTGTVQTGCQ
jgi:parallel beta-helix repeat protein